MKTTLLLAVLACAGCTRFAVHQVDNSGGERVITTDFKATAWFSSSQNLTKLKALMTDKTQSFGVDASQQRGPTNTVATIEALTKLLEAARPTP